MTADRLVDTGISGNPRRILFNGAVLTSLEAMATRDGNGNAYLVVVNRDRTRDVAAIVERQREGSGRGTVWTLNGRSYLTYNTVAEPQAVRIERASLTGLDRRFTHTFPAHSVTAFRLDALKQE